MCTRSLYMCGAVSLVGDAPYIYTRSLYMYGAVSLVGDVFKKLK